MAIFDGHEHVDKPSGSRGIYFKTTFRVLNSGYVLVKKPLISLLVSLSLSLSLQLLIYIYIQLYIYICICLYYIMCTYGN